MCCARGGSIDVGGVLPQPVSEPIFMPQCESYRIRVFAPSVSNLVSLAGGWLCDRVQQGWRVSAAVAELAPISALHILGVTDAQPLDTFTSHDQRSGDAESATCAAVLVVCAAMLDEHPVVRQQVRAALGNPGVEVIAWGTIDATLDERAAHAFAPARRAPVSAAGRAFKVAALRAAGIAPDPSHAAEMLSRATRNLSPDQAGLSDVAGI